MARDISKQTYCEPFIHYVTLRNSTDLCLGDPSVPVRIKSARESPSPLGYPSGGRVR